MGWMFRKTVSVFQILVDMVLEKKKFPTNHSCRVKIIFFFGGGMNCDPGRLKQWSKLMVGWYPDWYKCC